MKVVDLTKFDEKEILECLNCGYMDVAKIWKLHDKCPKCGSEAFIVYEGARKGPVKIRKGD